MESPRVLKVDNVSSKDVAEYEQWLNMNVRKKCLVLEL